ncbi:Protein of unknown function [Noviherbaspirillum humi]|uniref:DUF3305 domain-containing protein n=1 Tax=Noviherbaspirillum humi TaxID=1688639 RepID=A0A239M518_9BURK|nr:DUF3305 domain-containing protein [Noviherbaspirillum humi]SNT37731.1 Protein of unknown function [Noviherbaspirillum humi]
MLMGRMPIAVIMQRRPVNHPWADASWSIVGVALQHGDLPAVQPLRQEEGKETVLFSGLQLELYPDENAGYFENWIAPEPKVFVRWRMEAERPMPVIASVSYLEGTRMLDSGDPADGVPMPQEVHAWLGAYLQAHYRPEEKRGRRHG